MLGGGCSDGGGAGKYQSSSDRLQMAHAAVAFATCRAFQQHSTAQHSTAQHSTAANAVTLGLPALSVTEVLGAGLLERQLLQQQGGVALAAQRLNFPPHCRQTVIGRCPLLWCGYECFCYSAGVNRFCYSAGVNQPLSCSFEQVGLPAVLQRGPAGPCCPAVKSSGNDLNLGGRNTDSIIVRKYQPCKNGKVLQDSWRCLLHG
jgi:hypothetical protein